MSQCQFDGCTNESHAYGLCQGHDRQSKLGLPLKPLRRIDRHSRTLKEKIERDIQNHSQYIDRGYATPCLELVSAYEHQRDHYSGGSFQGKKYERHREVYFIAHPEISREYAVCHHCDNRQCFNLLHLFHGTKKENTHDMLRKGRAKVKFSSDLIEEIRTLYKSGSYTQANLAERTGVSRQYISKLVRRKARFVQEH